MHCKSLQVHVMLLEEGQQKYGARHVSSQCVETYMGAAEAKALLGQPDSPSCFSICPAVSAELLHPHW